MKRFKWVFNAHMIYGAILGWLIVFSASEILDAAKHSGPGLIRGDSPQVVSESRYKRSAYIKYGTTLAMGVALWVIVASTAKPK